jgi:very-short-patch-repair endonuclease
VRKTLTVRPVEERTDAPRLQKKGRGWNIAESRLDTLHEAAREMRRAPTAAQSLLAQALIAADLGKYRFRRQVVIGSAIVDFACQPLKVVVEIDEPGADAELDRRRDRSLAEVGIKVLRFPAEDVVADVDAVTATIIAEMKARWHEQRARPNARRGYQR